MAPKRRGKRRKAAAGPLPCQPDTDGEPSPPAAANRSDGEAAPEAFPDDRAVAAYIAGTGPAPRHIVEARTRRGASKKIMMQQAEAARGFAHRYWVAWHGTWPADYRTSPVIKEECTRIMISDKQLKYQWDKYAKDVAGRGVRHDGRERFEESLRKLIGDGVGMIDDAFAAAKDDPLLAVRCRDLGRLSELDNPKTRELFLGLLHGYARDAAVVWEGGLDALDFDAKRHQQRNVFREAVSKDHEVRAVAVVFEKHVYRAYRDATRTEKPPPIAWPPTDYVLKVSKGQDEALYHIAGYLVFKIWKRFCQEKGELADFAKSLVGVMSIPEATAISDKLPVGKTAHGNRGGRIYARRIMYDFVRRLEAVFTYNLTFENEDYHGSALLSLIGALVDKDATLCDKLREAIRPRLPEQYRGTLPRPIYALIIEKYQKARRKDYAKVRNREYAEERRTDPYGGGCPLRPALEANTAAARGRGEECD